MKQTYILALDQGTTSSRAIIYDKEAKPRGVSNRELTQHYPAPGWVEHDANEIFDTQLEAMKLAIKDLADHEGKTTQEIESLLVAIGVANQRETVVVWEKSTGNPVYNAIVWQCRRTADLCEDLVRRGMADTIREKTGLVIDAYFSATKIQWLLESIPGLRKRAERGEILAGTIDTWLIWKLSGGKAHVTDYTNASRTMLFNIYLGEWDTDLLNLFTIPRCILPQVRNSSEVYCTTDEGICGFSVPIASAIGDQQAALFGQGCVNAGDTKNTYGTGCFMLMHTGEKPVVPKSKLLTTIALGYNGTITYALEGSVFIAGAIIQWLRDELELIDSASQCNALAESVTDSNGAYLVPAFVGLGTPYWDMYARGTIVGLTRGVKKAHICRAALDAIAYQVKDVLDCMVAESGVPLTALKVDGGASVSDMLMQFQADILSTTVSRPKDVEITALGAAFLAGLAVGFWKDKNDIQNYRKTDKTFTPLMSPKRRNILCAGWKKAVERALGWEEEP